MGVIAPRVGNTITTGYGITEWKGLPLSLLFLVSFLLSQGDLINKLPFHQYLFTLLAISLSTANSKIKTNGQVLYILNYIKYDKSKDFEKVLHDEIIKRHWNIVTMTQLSRN